MIIDASVLTVRHGAPARPGSLKTYGKFAIIMHGEKTQKAAR